MRIEQIYLHNNFNLDILNTINNALNDLIQHSKNLSKVIIY